MASSVGRWGATRRTTCTASSRSGTSTWIWAPQMCCSLTSTWYSCCMCAKRAPAEMSPPSRSTSGTVPAATTPRPCGSAAPASRARSRCRCAAQLVEGVAHRRVGLHQRSLQLGRELRAVELAQERVDLGGGPPRLEVHDVELFLGPDLELPAGHGRDGRQRVLRGGCRGVTGRGGECTREAARLPLTSHLRAGCGRSCAVSGTPERCADTGWVPRDARSPVYPQPIMADDMYTVERSTTIDAPPERIYQQIANLHNWRNWSPWEGLDPDLRRIYSTKIMWFVKFMDAAPLTHPPHRDDRQSVDRATSVSGSVDQALITGTDRGCAGRRGRRRILADLALCALRGAAFLRAAGLTSCGCC